MLALTACIALAILTGQPDTAPRRGTEAWRAMKRRVAYDRVRARYLRDEEASILAGLREIEKRLEKHRLAVIEVQSEIDDLQFRLQELERQRAHSRRALAAVRREAGKRAAAMMRLRRTSIPRILARVRDPVAGRRMQDRFRYVLGHDTALLKRARAADEEIAETERQLAEDRAARAVARGKLEREIEDEALLEEERRALAAAVRGERRAAERLVRELASAARKLEQEMRRFRGETPALEAAPGGFAAQRGRLPWPTRGRVEVGFGKRVDPASNVVLVSNGLDIRAGATEPVRGVFAGQVVYADNFEGFGRLLIVAHDGGWFTLYAHLASFAVRVGDAVAQHQVIGFVGETGSTKGPYLYFEVRKGRKPVDPMRWLSDG